MSMARNTVPSSYEDLMVMASDAASGAGAVGAAVGLVLNLQNKITTDRTALLTAETNYQTASGTLSGLSATLAVAVEEGSAFCTQARDVLKARFGNQYSNAWVPTGFVGSLAIPRTDAELLPLTERLKNYFTANPTHEVSAAPITVTAARALAAYNALLAGRSAITTKEGEVGTLKSTRDTAKTALRKRLRGLINELRQLMGPDDPRWRSFGLNIPSAPRVPAVPEGIQADASIPGKLLVTCGVVPTATRYRFWTQRTGLDDAPVFAGVSLEASFLIENLTPGELKVFVSAANDGGESSLSDALVATVTAPSGSVPAQAFIGLSESQAEGAVHLGFEAEGATSFQVWHKGPGDAQFTLADTVATGDYVKFGLAEGAHEYKVVGVNATGNGPASDVVSVEVAEAVAA